MKITILATLVALASVSSGHALEPSLGPEVSINSQRTVLGTRIDVAAGSHAVAVWAETGSVSGVAEIRAALVEVDGTTIERGVISDGEATGVFAIASGGQGFLVAWATDHGVRARRLSPTGEPVDSAPIVISSGDSLFMRGLDVAWDGRRFLIAWPSGGSIVGTRIEPIGDPIDRPPLVLAEDSGNSRQIELAWSGSDYLVAWERFFNVGNFGYFTTRISPTGAPLGGVRFLGDRWEATRFALASLRHETLLTFAAHPARLSPQRNVYGLLFDGAGAPVTSLVIAPAPAEGLETGSGDQVSLVDAIVEAPDGFNVLYQEPERIFTTARAGLKLARVTADGTISTPVAVTPDVVELTSLKLFQVAGRVGLLYTRANRVFFRLFDFQPPARRRAAEVRRPARTRITNRPE